MTVSGHGLCGIDTVEVLEPGAAGVVFTVPAPDYVESVPTAEGGLCGALPWEDKNRDLLFVGHGSNVSCLVGLIGQNANHLRGLR